MRKLLILSFSNIAADARVLKQIAGFSDDYEVTTCGYGPQPPGADRHVEVDERYPIWAYPKGSVVLRRFSKAYWENPAILDAAEQLANQEFDVVLANELDAVPLALSLKPAHGVHADLHEYSPKEKEDVLKWRVFIAPFRTWLAKTYLKECGSATTVAPEIARKYEEVFGIPMGLVRNATPFYELPTNPVSVPIRLVHSGACLADRRPEVMLEALKATTNNLTLDLYLTPNDPGKLEDLKLLAASDPRITIHDPVPYSQLVETLNKYDVGVSVLPPLNYNNLWALPNKLFDYIQARLGVVVGPSPEMARVVREERIGAVAGGFDTAALTKVFDAITVPDVELWKRNSDVAAGHLSAAKEVEGWRRAIDALAGA